METEIKYTKDYLLLIDEEAEIKKGDYILEKEYIINIFPDYLTDLDECDKIIAYYPLTNKAEELDLPLLPNPFEEQAKQYSLEDIQKAFEAGVAWHVNPNISELDAYTSFIQSLSTQQLPKEFIPTIFYRTSSAGRIINLKEYSGFSEQMKLQCKLYFASNNNSEGKEVIQGEWIY